MAPKHDPVPLVTLMGASTHHLGVVATMSTLSYPPFLLARLCSTVDHICGGRLGWNIVTSAENAAAQNFGLDELPPRELRYDMADEYMDLVNQLFESWEPDAVMIDRELGTYADFKKVHPIHFQGKYFKSRGPLNTVPSPQRRPTYVQAGGSPKGRQFAAKHADSIISVCQDVKGMKEYRDDVRARAVAQGRDPDEIKVMFLVAPILGATEEEAQGKYQRLLHDPGFISLNLSLISAITDIDFEKFDLDQPLPERLVTNGEQGSLDRFQQWGSGKTLRSLVVEASGGLVASVELVGTPDQVADRMGEVMEEVGGDGFLITSMSYAVSRVQIAEITDGLIPALQRRDLVRKQYQHSTLRETLREF